MLFSFEFTGSIKRYEANGALKSQKLHIPRYRPRNSLDLYTYTEHNLSFAGYL